MLLVEMGAYIENVMRVAGIGSRAKVVGLPSSTLLHTLLLLSE